jgi:hypothetical protein
MSDYASDISLLWGIQALNCMSVSFWHIICCIIPKIGKTTL